MMKLHPFSHSPGTPCVVPGSAWVVEPFPALLRVRGGGDFPLSLSGPVSEFTIQLDLERDSVWVWGHAVEGHFRYQLRAEPEGLTLRLDRAATPLRVGDTLLHPKETLVLAPGGALAEPCAPIERLSLGSFRAQDVERMRREPDTREIAPLLFALGQKVAGAPFDLGECELTSLFLAGFSGLFVPHTTDPLHQGIALDLRGCQEPLALLPAAYAKIRSWLLDGERVLPELPREWEAGRVVGLRTHGGLLDVEWRKSKPFRMVFRGSETPEFVFPKGISGFRSRSKGSEIHYDQFIKL